MTVHEESKERRRRTKGSKDCNSIELRQNRRREECGTIIGVDQSTTISSLSIGWCRERPRVEIYRLTYKP